MKVLFFLCILGVAMFSWMTKEISNAPELDEEGNIIDKKKEGA